MTVTKFIKTPKLFEYLDLEVSEALHRHDIRDMFDYAWVGEDTPSNEFVGLAMWGSEHHSPVLYGCQTPTGYSREEYARLITTCEDLESLMKLARLAIGHTLWMSDLIKSQSIFFFHDHHFWLNHINSVTLLGMASDRLRDLFLAAYFRTTFEEYKKANRKRDINPGGLQSGFYQYPFADASSAPRRPEIATNLVELFDLAGEIYLSRENRNATVHDLATKAARFMKEFLAANSPGVMTRDATSHKEMLANSQKVHDANCTELDDAIRFVTGWYRDLVKATSITFEVEYVLERNPATP
jgi:hypothetical protein